MSQVIYYPDARSWAAVFLLRSPDRLEVVYPGGRAVTGVRRDIPDIFIYAYAYSEHLDIHGPRSAEEPISLSLAPEDYIEIIGVLDGTSYILRGSAE